MITTPEIICDLFSFFDKDQIERIQLVNKLWNNVIIRHKNILPLRQFVYLRFISNQIQFQATKEDVTEYVYSYIINFDGANLSKGSSRSLISEKSTRYSHLAADEVLTNLNDIVFDFIQIEDRDSEDRRLDNLLNMIKFVTTKTGGRFRGRFGHCDSTILDSKLVEIFDNYIIVDVLTLGYFNSSDSYIREVCANPEIVQLPSTPKEIRLLTLLYKKNDEVLNYTCNGKLNGANRLTIEFKTLDNNYGDFIRQWFELYRTHENPISLVGKFELRTYGIVIFNAIKRFLNNAQFRVKYSLETTEFHNSTSLGIIKQYLNRRCVLHETDSYALVIEMEYDIKDMSSINASDLDQPPCYKLQRILFCVKSL